MEINEVLEAVHGSHIGISSSDKFHFSSVTTDSRNVVSGSLFVPLVGSKQDGHKYIQKAIEKGSSVIFVNSEEYAKNSHFYITLAEQNNVSLIEVSDTLYALQDIATAYVAKFPNLKKIAITGSSGKTTTKELIVSILKQKYRVVYNDGNFNSETGLPLSVFKIRDDDEIGVFEMGMNRENEIGEIAGVLKPQFAVITNIGSAHIGILGSRENIAKEKRKIFSYINDSGVAFIPSSDMYASFLSENVQGKIINFGKNITKEKSGVSFIKDAGLDGTIFEVGDNEVHFALPGMYNYENALAAISVGKYFGVSDEDISKVLSEFSGVFNRSEIEHIVLKNGAKIILLKDCYNANSESMAEVLSLCTSLKNINKRIYVLGDMLELGEVSSLEHKKIGNKVLLARPQIVIFVGKEMKFAFDVVNENSFSNVFYFEEYSYDTIEKIAKIIIDNSSDGDLLLLKASHSLSFERVVPLIEKESA